MKEVADIIRPDLKVLFIGFNPGMRSALTGHHFAGHTNKFWKLLYAARLTADQLAPNEDKQLLQFGYGILISSPRSSRTAAEISPEEYRQGRLILLAKLACFRPRIACYAGIGVYKALTGKKMSPVAVRRLMQCLMLLISSFPYQRLKPHALF